MARTTITIKGTPSKALLRALKITADDLTPGADITSGDARVQVADTNVSDIRVWARENGFQVGERGRFSKTVTDAYEAHLKDERKAKREAAKARKAEREAAAAQAETVTV